MTSAIPPEPALSVERGRFWRITSFFAWMIGRIILWDIVLRKLAPGWVLASRPGRWRQHARDFRGLAVSMGGVLIKLGQFLSARVDVLPEEITTELQGLQDEVPPVPRAQIEAALVRELPGFNQIFDRVEYKPMAAASLGQTHRAWLRPAVADELDADAAVVIKVQRPGIEAVVRTDLAALRVVARWVMRYRPIGRRADVPALMEEFAVTLWEELDYVAEAENARRFQAMFADDHRVHIPAIYDAYSTAHLLLLENVEGIKISDIPALQEAGVDTVEVADRLLDVYFRQIFKEGFFHADPHPGNLFVRPLPDDDWTPEQGPRPYELIFVDFGMVGRVKALMSQNLKKVLISVSQRDARGLTQAYWDMGFFLPSADFDRIVEAQTVLLDQLWGRNLLDMSRPDPQEVAALGEQFRDILYDFPFQVPRDFIYLGRALGMLSGLASILDPDINPWYQVERYGRELIAEQAAGRRGAEALLDLLGPYLALPGQMQRVVAAAESGRLRLTSAPDRPTARRLESLEKRVGRLNWSILGAAGMISAMLWWLDRKRSK